MEIQKFDQILQSISPVGMQTDTSTLVKLIEQVTFMAIRQQKCVIKTKYCLWAQTKIPFIHNKYTSTLCFRDNILCTTKTFGFYTIHWQVGRIILLLLFESLSWNFDLTLTSFTNCCLLPVLSVHEKVSRYPKHYWHAGPVISWVALRSITIKRCALIDYNTPYN